MLEIDVSGPELNVVFGLADQPNLYCIKLTIVVKKHIIFYFYTG